MKNLPILLFALLFLASCGEDQTKSGTSDHRIVQSTDDNSSEVDNSTKAPLVVDSNNTEVLNEMEREKIAQKADEILANRPEQIVRVSGTIIGGAGMDITLDKLGGKTNMEPIKTTIINEDGYFELDATTSQEQIFALRTDAGNMILFLDGGNYEVNANIEELSKYQVNAPMSYKVRDYYLILEEFNGRFDKIKKREDRYTKKKVAWKVKRLLDSMPYYNAQIEKERAEAIINFINNNRNSPFAAEAANRLDYLRHTAFLEELYNELVQKFPYSSYVKNMGLKLVNFRPMAVGKTAPEIVMPDVDGNNYRLSDFKGKHVLVYFNYSTLEPGIQFSRDLAPIYHQYNSKGFEVFNVFVGEMEENFRLYVEESEAPWPVVSDLLGQKSTAFDYYIAHEFPMTYMIDANGKIAAKFLSLADIEAYLKKNL